MKQPELGKRIVEFRKEKGLTQEELVEKCNLSVRTIQRIESGEVTPRSYTIKNILNALDKDVNLFNDLTSSENFGLKDWFSFKYNNNIKHLTLQLNLAWIFGIISLFFEFFELILEFLIKEESTVINDYLYCSIKLFSIFSTFFFLKGFYFIGKHFKSYLLSFSAILFLFISVLITGFDICFYVVDLKDVELLTSVFVLPIYGIISVLFGLSLIRLKHILGTLSNVAGIFEIIGGSLIITVILSFIGILFLIPSGIFEIIILFKTINIINDEFGNKK